MRIKMKRIAYVVLIIIVAGASGFYVYESSKADYSLDQTRSQDNKEPMKPEYEIDNIDIYDNHFAITYDMALKILSEKIGVQNTEQQIGFTEIGFRVFNEKYYYAIACYYNDNPDIVFTFARYCVDVYTGEVFELLSMAGFEELVMLSGN